MKYLFIIQFMLTSLLCMAQESYQGLKVGDKLPDALVANLINSNKNTINFDGLKGKIIILDFWATWCSPCIRAMPALDSLQRKFKEEIFILPVTDEDQNIVGKFLNKTPAMKSVQLPIAINDKMLRILFPHTGLPHDVVIDQNGVVKLKTSPEEITDKLVINLLNNRTIYAKSKVDRLNFNPFLPHFLKNDLDSCKISFMLTGYIDGILSSTSAARKQNPKSPLKSFRIAATNTTKADLFRLALKFGSGSSNDLSNQQVIYRGNNKNSFFYPKNLSPKEQNEWCAKNCYCVEAIVPSNLNINDYFKQQLDLYFNVKSKREDLNTDCYVLKCVDSTLLFSKTATEDYVQDEGKEKWTIKHGRLKPVLGMINSFSNFPIINETKLANPWIDIYFSPSKINDLNEFNKELRPQGLVVSKEKRITTFMVIEENPVKD